jgi:hypothetical protein
MFVVGYLSVCTYYSTDWEVWFVCIRGVLFITHAVFILPCDNAIDHGMCNISYRIYLSMAAAQLNKNDDQILPTSRETP